MDGIPATAFAFNLEQPLDQYTLDNVPIDKYIANACVSSSSPGYGVIGYAENAIHVPLAQVSNTQLNRMGFGYAIPNQQVFQSASSLYRVSPQAPRAFQNYDAHDPRTYPGPLLPPIGAIEHENTDGSAENQRSSLDSNPQTSYRTVRTGHFHRMRTPDSIRVRRVPSDPTDPVECHMVRQANYQGRNGQHRLRSLECPENENVAIWVTNLPANTSYHMLLEMIPKGVGKVLSLYINQPIIHSHPTPWKRNRRGCAATLCFFKRESTELMIYLSAARPMYLGGRQVHMGFSTNKFPPWDPDNGESRVLIIKGDPAYVNSDVLCHFLENEKGIYYQTETFKVTGDEEGNNIIEWRFGSFRAQAQLVYRAIQRELKDHMTVEYGIDPCAVAPPGFNPYGYKG